MTPDGGSGSRPDPGADRFTATMDDLAVSARPYLLTGGRTRPRAADIAIETLVVRAERPTATTWQATPEHRQILTAISAPISVAELAAVLGLPVTVTLVLVGDLVADGLLVASSSSAMVRQDIPFLERLIAGVAGL